VDLLAGQLVRCSERDGHIEPRQRPLGRRTARRGSKFTASSFGHHRLWMAGWSSPGRCISRSKS
jgi:hypothetical protein